jgi:signal transduction histidine kinase
VIQSLFGVGMGVQGVASLATDERIVVRLEDSVREIDRVIRDLRNYIFGLRPGILADRQLDQALRAVAEGFAERSGVTTVVDIDERLAAELGSRAGDLVQIAREALSNVGRHAEATTCRVRLAREGGSAVLEIDDDGRGFDGEPSRPGGQGVSNLRARAEALGGATEISGVPGEGTTVRVEIPLTESAVTPRSAR